MKFKTLLIALGAIVLTACMQSTNNPATELSLEAPAWSLQSANGETVHFPGDAGGRPVMLLFWATWCPYCKALMPHLQSILDEFPDAGLLVYAISFMDDGDPAAVIGKQGFDFIVLVNGEAVAEDYGINSTPAVLLVDSQGFLRFDLREIQARQGMQAISAKDMSHSLKAARKAPYFAAAIRRGVDQLLAETSSP